MSRGWRCASSSGRSPPGPGVPAVDHVLEQPVGGVERRVRAPHDVERRPRALDREDRVAQPRLDQQGSRRDERGEVGHVELDGEPRRRVARTVLHRQDARGEGVEVAAHADDGDPGVERARPERELAAAGDADEPDPVRIGAEGGQQVDGATQVVDPQRGQARAEHAREQRAGRALARVVVGRARRLVAAHAEPERLDHERRHAEAHRAQRVVLLVALALGPRMPDGVHRQQVARADAMAGSGEQGGRATGLLGRIHAVGHDPPGDRRHPGRRVEREHRAAVPVDLDGLECARAERDGVERDGEQLGEAGAGAVLPREGVGPRDLARRKGVPRRAQPGEQHRTQARLGNRGCRHRCHHGPHASRV